MENFWKAEYYDNEITVQGGIATGLKEFSVTRVTVDTGHPPF